MVIKRMLGSSMLVRELAHNRQQVAKDEHRNDSSFMMFGPSIWDGLEEAAFQSALVNAYPVKGRKSFH